MDNAIIQKLENENNKNKNEDEGIELDSNGEFIKYEINDIEE